ncbi:MAG: SDR family oxidoreductase [Alphaproteobacteria bacterium]|nr:SDR family oxidoreductase [Alphaproteobacteria bacterium]MBU1516606.1 SDR family oxidoreductase [Alphaproteobacteria bacterium]MBU2094362.1 SDR family oxidoreductase [Alphaproteobacteria bacterium]MBU2153247.1 SDR family oxidoreductase [Alphaproteobacteria bacterium]MBU2307533.1 SDR family oxidoreductase [Alphaproteobacteria bacterium]
MKIVIIGGSGRIGRKLVFDLRQNDYRVLEASPSFGVDAISGFGLDEALEGAEVMVDVSNSPTLDGETALRFFDTAGLRLAAAARAAGIRHHVALSIVGTDRLQASGYFRAKKRQEDLIKASGLPFTILRSTQFFEFIAGVVQDGARAEVRISPACVQPISGLDVAEALADLATGAPLNDTIEVAGPERFRLSDLAVEVLTAYEDSRRVAPDPAATYFGATLEETSLLPGRNARIAALGFDDWLRSSLQPTPVATEPAPRNARGRRC